MQDFHPDLKGAARWLPRGTGRAWFVRLSNLLFSLPLPSPRLPKGFTLEEHRINDIPEVNVRVFTPPDKGAARRPALLWIHGGGYIMGSARQDDIPCIRFAQELDAVVLSVEHRLAPRYPYPTPLEDCFDAFAYLHQHAAPLGIDPARVIIGGQSAGGGLAAALALLIHDRKRPTPLLQLLVYPMLDDRTTLRQFDERYHRLWDQKSNLLGWSAYLNRKPGSDDVAAYAAPARRDDLSGLPPAWIGVAQHDLFYQENMTYARRLRDAGVPTTTEVVHGAYHGFDAFFPNAPISRQFFSSQVNAIQHALHTP